MLLIITILLQRDIMDNSTTPDNVLYCFLNLIMVRAPIYQQ